MKPTEQELKDKVFGVELDYCLFCGEKIKVTRHHVIPKALMPKYNVTIPLCDKHKDITHVIVRQFYFPKHLRKNISTITKLADNLKMSTKSLNSKLDFKKQSINTKVIVTN
ncbi:MAG: hypothetical protein WC755_07085 [Candidatus Woesearchaeota archaeon]|jgi:hypothetical protein